MPRKRLVVALALFAPLVLGLYMVADLAIAARAPVAKKAPAAKAVEVATCYACHGQIKDFHQPEKHAKVNCANCHEKLEAHLQAPGPASKPVTRTDHAACGA